MWASSATRHGGRRTTIAHVPQRRLAYQRAPSGGSAGPRTRPSDHGLRNNVRNVGMARIVDEIVMGIGEQVMPCAWNA